MHLSLNESYIFFSLPGSTDIFLRKGNWEVYDKQLEGFLISDFSKKVQYIITNKAYRVNEQFKIEAPNETNNIKEFERHFEEEIIQKNINACKGDNLKKVISSRTVNFNTNKEVNLFSTLKKLVTTYPTALVYLANIPNQSMWMGATPETLIRKSKVETYTIALAGTQAYEKKLLWNQKEIDEHNYVIDDIKSKLRELNINYDIGSTETVKAGEVGHLKTKINLQENNLSSKIIADKLHPTAAVCGIPQKEANSFIRTTEPHQREFYTGYLGELDENKESWFFVNLRCMQVFKNSFCLYVGGGITKDSIVEKEWEETALKAKTLLSVLTN